MTPSLHAPEPFALVKWYLDAVEPDGSATIAYWASLGWHGLDVNWHDVTRYAPGDAPRERSSRRRVPPPAMVDGTVAWESKPLAIATVHEALVPGVTVTLLDDARGRIQWECLAPAARVRVASDGAMRTGSGYAERLSMSVLPWDLPMDALRWGRWMSDDATAALVWIDWRGPAPQRWVVHDGVLCDGGTVGDDSVALDAGRLALGAPRTLHDRSVGRLLRGIPGLARVAARIPLAWQETKWCSRATWTGASGVPRAGWALHELVTFR